MTTNDNSNTANTENAMIDKKVKIKDGYYAGHWGFICDIEDGSYVVTGGSIGDSFPMFEREDFTVTR